MAPRVRPTIALTRENYTATVAPIRYDAPIWNPGHEHIERYDRTDGFMYRIMVGEQPSGPEKYARYQDLPNFITMLKALGWNTEFDAYAGIVCFRPSGRIMNGALVVHKHQVRADLRQRERQIESHRRTYETLRSVRIQRLDEGVLRAMVAQVRAWPEVMEVAYMGTKIRGDNPVYPIESGLMGEILVRFYPVYFNPENDGHVGETVNGLTTPCTFGVDMNGAVRFIEGQHPHVYVEGRICEGEAEFNVNQMHSLDQLRHWYVGTDGGPANGEWHQTAEQFWSNLNWREMGGAGLWFNARYIQEEPSLYIAAPWDGSDEAVMCDLTLENVLELVYQREQTETTYCSFCDRPYEYSEDDGNPLNFCDACENRFCDHCDSWFGWSEEDDEHMCNSCYNEAENERQAEAQAEEEEEARRAEEDDEEDEDENMSGPEFDNEPEMEPEAVPVPALTYNFATNEHRFEDQHGHVWASITEQRTCSRCGLRDAVWQYGGIGERCLGPACRPMGRDANPAPDWRQAHEPEPVGLYREDYGVATGTMWRCEYPDYHVFIRAQRQNTTTVEPCVVTHPERHAVWRVNEQRMHDRGLEGQHIAGYLCQEHYEALPSRVREEAPSETF